MASRCAADRAPRAARRSASRADAQIHTRGTHSMSLTRTAERLVVVGAPCRRVVARADDAPQVARNVKTHYEHVGALLAARRRTVSVRCAVRPRVRRRAA